MPATPPTGDADRIPVIIGVGEINDRPVGDEPGLDSVELMAQALLRASADATGGDWIAQADWLAIVPQISFRDLDVPRLLPAALNIAPRNVAQAASPDGDSPVRLINEAAQAIANGNAAICLLVGGEALRTAGRRAAASGKAQTLFAGSLNAASPLRKRYGLINPADVYPFYENAARAAWGQTLAQGQAETGRIWSAFSHIAMDAQGAWIKQPRTPGEITEFSADNRPLAFPYSKLQVANSSVNQGAAVIMTSLARARAAGIDDARLVHIGAGAAAHEPDDHLARAEFTGTPSMDVVLKEVMVRNGLTPEALGHAELYSCFPCVPKMARRQLGLSDTQALSVHGGLTFGGGPIGNYMMHAAAAMVRKLRAGQTGSGGDYGLLFGNGGYCTHNHAIVLARHPVAGVSHATDYHVQAEADARRNPIPPLTDTWEGPVTIETYTVFHDRAGDVTYGVVLARNPAGERVVARIDAADQSAIDFLTSGADEPVGAPGHTERHGDMLHFHLDQGASR